MSLNKSFLKGCLASSLAFSSSLLAQEDPLELETPAEEPVPQVFPASEEFDASDDVPTTNLQLEKAALVNAQAPKTAEVEKIWQVSGEATYIGSFEAADTALSFGLGISRKMSDFYRISFNQELVKFLQTDASKDEIELDDTVISLALKPGPFLANLNWTWVFKTTLPVSKDSQFQEIYTKTSAHVSTTVPWSASVNASFGGSVRYTWSAYETAPPEQGEGGTPLEVFNLALKHSTAFELTEKWTFIYDVSYIEKLYHDVDYAGLGDPELNHLPDQGYSLLLLLDWAVSNRSNLNLGYTGGSLLHQPGFADYVLYDQIESRWLSGISHKF